MSVLVKKAIIELRGAIMDAAGKAVADGIFPPVPLGDFIVEVPSDGKNGDYSSNAAMAWAKDLKIAPRKIAAALSERLDLSETFFERCETAGPGFLNFYFNGEFYAHIARDVLEKGGDYGRSDYGAGEKVDIEFVSANPTGPMHMGNARGGALGDCLASVMEFAGFDVFREFYVNDSGNQIDKFALSLDVRYRQIYEGEDAVELPEDSYRGDDVVRRAEEFAALYGDKYIRTSENERREALIKYALPKNIADMKKILDGYRVNFDRWFYESRLYEDGEFAETLEILKSKDLTYEKDGALWYKNKEVLAKRLAKEGKTPEEIERLGLKDEVLIRANGNPTYFASDIAYHRNKLKIRGFDKAIDVWGADHHGHVARLKGALDAVGCDGDDLDVVLTQLVRLSRGGKTVRMSKRSGKAITLEDLLEEIPVDALRFMFNMREPGSQMEFDLDLAVKQSRQNPVYYCQYAHARICGVLRKSAAEGKTPRECSIDELKLLNSPEERELIALLSSFTGEIINAAKNYDPARITRYAVDLATLFHKFYNARRINCGDDSLTQARLSLCLCVKNVLKNILTMFRVSVPERMARENEDD